MFSPSTCQEIAAGAAHPRKDSGNGVFLVAPAGASAPASYPNGRAGALPGATQGLTYKPSTFQEIAAGAAHPRKDSGNGVLLVAPAGALAPASYSGGRAGALPGAKQGLSDKPSTCQEIAAGGQRSTTTRSSVSGPRSGALAPLLRQKTQLDGHAPAQVRMVFFQPDGDGVQDITGLGGEGLADLFHYSGQ